MKEILVQPFSKYRTASKSVEEFHDILTLCFLPIFSSKASPQRSGAFTGQTAGDTEGMWGGSCWYCLAFGKHSRWWALISTACKFYSVCELVVENILWELLGCLKLWFWACDFQTSLRQMNQTRFYIEESRNQMVQVNLILGGFPTQLDKEEYAPLLSEHFAVKSESAHLCVLEWCVSSRFKPLRSFGF